MRSASRLHTPGSCRRWSLVFWCSFDLMIPVILSAQSISDKKAERQAAVEESQADTLRLESEREAARESQGDTLEVTARPDSVKASRPSKTPIETRLDSVEAALGRIYDTLQASQRAKIVSDSTALAVRLNPTHSSAEHEGDPERDHYFDDRDANFVNASVIKSIAGEKPSNEFFDLRFRVQIFDGPGHVDTMVVDTVAAGSGGKLQTREVHVGPNGMPGKQLKIHPRQPWSLFTISAIDVALSTVIDSTSSDSGVQRERRKLTEATLAVEVGLPAVVRMSDNKVVRFRRYFFGPLIKVFSADPYYGISGGSVELEGSAFRSSYLFTALIRRFYPNPELRLHNFYVEFYLRSKSVDFFKILSLRGGVLFPLGKDAARQGVTSRIAIEVPVVSWPF
jgi:hypothetical protein